MKNIRIGVFGAKRGYYYFDNLLANNAEIVAVCDKDNNSLERAKNRLANDVAIYSDFDSFIEHPMHIKQHHGGGRSSRKSRKKEQGVLYAC